MGLWAFGTTLWRSFVLGTPRAEVMGLIGFLALAANVASVLILLKYRDGDADVRSVWLCSRNDAIGNAWPRLVFGVRTRVRLAVPELSQQDIASGAP
jgi:Co/Zn/Cd efflux system component